MTSNDTKNDLVPSEDSSLSEKKDGVSSLIEATKIASNAIVQMKEDPSEEGIRKVLSAFGRDLTKGNKCPHGCTFLCRACDG
jgi:hypothetical protein